MHKAYKFADQIEDIAIKEFNEIHGIRPDFIDRSTNTIYELKPFNPKAIAQGVKQLYKYKAALELHTGEIWNIVLDTY